MKKPKKFTFYWRDGKRDVFEGEDPADALNRAGYGGGAVAALDFYSNGETDEYEWIDRDWRRKQRLTNC